MFNSPLQLLDSPLHDSRNIFHPRGYEQLSSVTSHLQLTEWPEQFLAMAATRFVVRPPTLLPASPAPFTSLALAPLLPLPPFLLVSFPLAPLTAFVTVPLKTLFGLVPLTVLLLSSQRPTDHHHHQCQAQRGEYRFCPTRHR